MEFEYNYQLLPQNLLTIANTGSCAIEAYDSMQCVYYLIIQSDLGTMTITKCGPMYPEITDALPEKFYISVETMDYNSQKIERAIDMFLSNKPPKVEAKIVPIKEAIDSIINLKEYLLNIKIADSDNLEEFEDDDEEYEE